MTCQCSADCHAWQLTMKLHAVAAAWGSMTLQGLIMGCRLSTDMVMVPRLDVKCVLSWTCVSAILAPELPGIMALPPSCLVFLSCR